MTYMCYAEIGTARKNELLLSVLGGGGGVKRALNTLNKLITSHGHVAMSSQGMQDHLGAKSANWLAG